ncbi:MAG: hypothetical protein J5702_00960 [Bacteroidales bacterium]|nr:hypothetical protein [Bacteroidales bacterium]
MRKAFLLILSLLLCSGLGAQQIAERSFAIFVDKATAEACRGELEAYRDAIAADGLPAEILAGDWATPESVRDRIRQLYRDKGLEGAVFVGDIPVAMIRGAQHFTSAFKMDQKQFPMFDSSVPSDRFYDDFGLKFRFIAQDSTRHDLFYYWLTGDSAQRIHSDIYTGRIRAVLPGEEGFAQIRAYLKKAAAAHRENNPLDRVVSYTGEGSFSNSLSAWKDESITLREQMPAAFRDADGAKFYMFYMYPDIKNVLAREMAREDVDLMLFHEHGTPDRQWLTHSPDPESEDEMFQAGKLAARQLLRRNVRYGSDPKATMEKNIREYGIDSTWFAGWDDPAVQAQDSIDDLATGIVLDDVRRYNPNPRFVIFDACYNGDFREQDFIAAEYILGSGRTVACLGNSVNVLQDKSSSDLLGMLSEGYSVGQWAQQVNILESHIIGDPTFRFTAAGNTAKPDLRNGDATYWLSVLRDGNLPADLQSIALYKLFDLKYPGLSDLLRDTYFSSPYYTQRLQCLHLLPFYNDGNYATVLKAALEDPYEFIRRKAVYYMGKVGHNDFVPYIVKLYMEDWLSERIAFNVWQSLSHLDTGLAEDIFDDAIEKADLYDKDAFRKNVEASLNSARNMYVSSLRAMTDPEYKRYKKSFTTSLRNNPYPALVPDALRKLSDTSEDVQYRILLAEALGWYVRAWNRADIIAGCEKILAAEPAMDPTLADELTKTINRLKEYMR